MNLLELQAQYSKLIQKVIENDGALDNATELDLANNEQALAKKVDSYDFIIKKLKADQSYFSDRIKEYQKAKKSLQNAEESLKGRIKLFLNINKASEVQGDDVVFKLCSSKAALIIQDESKVPEKYKKQILITEVEKELLRQDLETGMEIEGAYLEPAHSLRSYIKTKK